MDSKERKRLWRLAQGMKPRKKDPNVRFWEKVNKGGPVSEFRSDLGNCWIWTAQTDVKGYGHFHLGKQSYSGNIQAHRFSYQSIKGKIPEGLILDHLCRTRNCVNPDHLEPVTIKENCLRGFSPSIVSHKSGICIRGHKIEVGKKCKECGNIRYNTRYAKKVRQDSTT